MSLSDAQSLRVLRQWQSPTEAIRQAPDSAAISLAVWGLAAAVAVALGATPFVKVERVVTSEYAKIVSTEPLDSFQALDQAIIRSIDVKAGQRVKKGQVLATLDPTFATADVDQLRQQISGLDAEIIRARAEQNHAPLVFPAVVPPEEVPYAALQRSLFAQRAAQYAAQVNSFDEKIKNAEATLAKLQEDETRYQEREKIARQIQDMRDVLYKKGASSLLNLLAANDERLQLLQTLDGSHNSLIETQHQLSSLRADRDAFIQQWFTTISQEIFTTQNQHDLAAASLQKATRHKDLVRLTAADDSVVLDIAKVSVGSVLAPGDPVLTLARTNTPIEVEARIPARDVGFLRAGDPATLKVDAFNFFEHGTAQGHIRWISEGAFTADDNGQEVPPFYKAGITINAMNFTELPRTFRLIPGMTLHADIKVGYRSILTYIGAGFFRGMGEPMRQP